jgi:hypothetical protein
MPMVIKNSKRYCTSSNAAKDIIYDNKNSGMTATNTQAAIDELKNNLCNEEFGYNETGEFCHRQVGADTWLPFNGDKKWKYMIVDSLQNTNLGLTYESTWEEIAAGLNQLFPETLNVLSYLGVSSISLSGKAGSVWTSKEFDITHFNTMLVSASRSVSWNKWHSGWPSQPASAQAYLVTEKGDINLIGVSNVNISNYTGMAYIKLLAYSVEFMASTDGSNEPETMTELTAYTTASVSKMVLQV